LAISISILFYYSHILLTPPLAFPT